MYMKISAIIVKTLLNLIHFLINIKVYNSFLFINNSISSTKDFIVTYSPHIKLYTNNLNPINSTKNSNYHNVILFLSTYICLIL